MKILKNLRNLSFGVSLVMLVSIFLQASSWEIGVISFAELGKHTAVLLSLSVIFAGCAYVCDNLYTAKIREQQKLRMKEKTQVSSKNRAELMEKVKKPTFGTNSDEYIA